MCAFEDIFKPDIDMKRMEKRTKNFKTCIGNHLLFPDMYDLVVIKMALQYFARLLGNRERIGIDIRKNRRQNFRVFIRFIQWNLLKYGPDCDNAVIERSKKIIETIEQDQTPPVKETLDVLEKLVDLCFALREKIRLEGDRQGIGPLILEDE